MDERILKKVKNGFLSEDRCLWRFKKKAKILSKLPSDTSCSSQEQHLYCASPCHHIVVSLSAGPHDTPGQAWLWSSLIHHQKAGSGLLGGRNRTQIEICSCENPSSHRCPTVSLKFSHNPVESWQQNRNVRQMFVTRLFRLEALF